MKKLGIILSLVILVGVIIIVVVSDFRNTRPGSRRGSISEPDIEDYKTVDPSLVTYREIRNYKKQPNTIRGIAYSRQKIYLVADRFLQVINLKGYQLLKITLPDEPACLDVAQDGEIIIGFRNKIGLFNENGEQLWMADTLNSRAVITAVAVKDRLIFVADAGNRIVHRFEISGKYIDYFEGKSGGKDMHGFIIPSANFDLKLNRDGELWVVNPGKHALENYTYEGDLRASWENSSVELEGFSGCCNPAHFTFLPDGSFITSEKGIVRIKVHKPSGEFLAVVASPERFNENGRAPDIAAGDDGIIYALDYDRKIIRVFDLK